MFSVSGVENGSLLIAGSDKRGTIYGLFHISELMGVSPFVHFADVVPAPQKEIIFPKRLDAEQRTLREIPGVFYQ